MIRTIGVTKTFGTGSAATKALKEISFSIQAGEMAAIMGPSGCGKTTMLHILAGLEQADSGEIWIGDAALHTLNDNQRSQLRLESMGFVFQNYHLIPVLTAQENVAIPLIGRGEPSRSAAKKAKAALEQVGLGDKANRYPAELSGGQNQRVAIARAIVGKPSVIWADEPTGALDTATAEQVVGLLRQINEWFNTTVVMITHDRDIAASADRILRMESGRLVSEGRHGHV